MDITVIVPVFNLETCIEQAIKSIQMQHFNGTMEIIIVDDGSTDNSASIAKGIAEKDPRIRVITQRNAGVSAARNAGLEAACGDYIIFVDGDDILCADATSVLISAIKKCKNAILSCGDLIRIDAYDQVIPSSGNSQTNADNKHILKRILIEQYSVSACAKLFIREKIGDLRFVSGRKINEDKYFLIQYLMRNEGLVVDINDYVYGYYVRPGSASNSVFSDKSLDMIYFSERIYSDISESRPEIEALACYNCVAAHLAVMKKIVRSGMQKQYKSVFSDTRIKLLNWSGKLSAKQMKVHAWEVIILRYCPSFYTVCVKLFDAIKSLNR